MTETHEQEKEALERKAIQEREDLKTQYEEKIQKIIFEFEEKLKQLGESKDSEREQLRAEL